MDPDFLKIDETRFDRVNDRVFRRVLEQKSYSSFC